MDSLGSIEGKEGLLRLHDAQATVSIPLSNPPKWFLMTQPLHYYGFSCTVVLCIMPTADLEID